MEPCKAGDQLLALLASGHCRLPLVVELNHLTTTGERWPSQ